VVTQKETGRTDQHFALSPKSDFHTAGSHAHRTGLDLLAAGALWQRQRTTVARADLTPYTHEKPRIDINALNTALAWGAKESLEMNLEDYDRAPMLALNEIIWKSVRGAASEMPLPIARFHFRK